MWKPCRSLAGIERERNRDAPARSRYGDTCVPRTVEINLGVCSNVEPSTRVRTKVSGTGDAAVKAGRVIVLIGRIVATEYARPYSPQKPDVPLSAAVAAEFYQDTPSIAASNFSLPEAEGIDFADGVVAHVGVKVDSSTKTYRILRRKSSNRWEEFVAFPRES
jgi:hypothetical protein